MAIDSSSSTAASLAPGFRFHPTDEELVRYYLRRKICGKPFRFDAISEIDIYKVEPWDLPGKSRLKSRDLEWYFFSFLDKKYGNGSRTNRATDGGYWKTTGKDRSVYHRSQIVGMKKTLVYHSGRAPRGERTNWVMHEYRLIGEELQNSGIVQDSFVLCRIFRKSGSGPKNGEKYGAPFIEEEWEDEDELVMVPKEESAEEVPVGDAAFLDENDLEQILGTGTPSEEAPLPLSFCYGDDDNYVQEYTDFNDDDQKPLVGMGENQYEPEQLDDQKLFDLPVQYDINSKSVKHEYIGETSNNVNSVDVDYLLDEPFLDATDSLQFDNGSFLETNDLRNPVESDPTGFETDDFRTPVEADPSPFDMLDEYLTYFDAADENSKYLGSEELISNSAFFTDQHATEGNQQVAMANQQLLEGDYNNVASSSNQDDTKSVSKSVSDILYPYFNLGDIPAPPAYAAEFPTKASAFHLNSASSSSVHVTAGMIQISDTTSSGNGIDWSFGKHGHINIILSFGLSQGDDYSTSKDTSATIRGWFCFVLIWVLFLCMSFKIGTHICAR